MAQITIRKLDDAVMQALRKRAAASGRAVEDEARRALAIATGVDREAARERLLTARALLKGHADQPAEDLVGQMRDERTRDLSV